MNAVKIYTIYKNPSDFPHGYVVRIFLNDAPTAWYRVENSLDAIREHVPVGLTKIEPQIGDDSVIVETWF